MNRVSEANASNMAMEFWRWRFADDENLAFLEALRSLARA
jgi:hypothetical protein